MKILIFGDSGFVANYLIWELVNEFPESCINGMSRHVKNNFINKNICHKEGDILNISDVNKMISTTSPDFIINLASHSSVFNSWRDPIISHGTNYMGVLNLCLAMLKYSPEAKLLQISSTEVYGGSESRSTIFNEDSIINPLNPYAISKAGAEFIIKQYGLSDNLNYSILRVCSHTGPGRSPGFVLSGFAKQVAEIKKGIRDHVILAGNIDVFRQFLDVRDVVRAYVSVIKSDKTNQEIFNLCSEKDYQISKLLDTMMKLYDIEATVKKIKTITRPIDKTYILASREKFLHYIKWRQEINLEKTILDLLDYWYNLLQ